MKPGIYSGISNADYHADKGSYSSSLIKLMDTPALAKYRMDSPPEYKECFRLGSAIHKYILERDEFDDEFLTGIKCARRSNADKAAWSSWFRDHGADGAHIVELNPAAKWNGLFEAETGFCMVTPGEIDGIALMAESVARNDKAIKLLADGEAEQSVYWTDRETGLNLRCRPDYLSSFCSDLKSCRCAESSAFARDAVNLGYHISAAMYHDGVQQAAGEQIPFLFIALEKTPPYLCAIYRLDDDASELGYDIYRRNTRRLAECLDTGDWPGYADDLNLALPPYAFK